MRIPSSVEHYRYASSFQNLRKTLVGDRYADDLEKSLAYWVIPSDRRLPQAFLGRTLGEVLNTPFDELAATPGVGQKKMKTLLKLLARVAQRQPAAPDPAELDGHHHRKSPRRRHEHDGFDAAAISEETWQRWAQSIRAAGIEREKLGRLAPSLQPLPSVIWQTSLAWYLDRSLAEIRQLKTHGDKRVRVVLEVMHSVYEAMENVRPAGHLIVRLTPKFAADIEHWIDESLAAPQKVRTASVRESLLAPLVRQVAADCGTAIARVIESRLPIRSTPQTIHALSKRMRVTRARVYQLLEDAEQAIDIRWPEGRYRLQMLIERLASTQPEPEGLAAVRCAINALFPDAAENARRAEDKKSADK